jgi:hypothetical protein
VEKASKAVTAQGLLVEMIKEQMNLSPTATAGLSRKDSKA